jgi:biopolymer transport protein ExbD
MRRKKNLEMQEPEINITPLIDVVFVVLIMFIIIAPILEKDKIQLAKQAPGANHSKIEKSSFITIQVNAANQIFINKKLSQIEGIEREFIKLKSLYPDSTPQLFYDKKAYFENFEYIKSSLEKVGFNDLDLVIEPGT